MQKKNENPNCDENPTPSHTIFRSRLMRNDVK